MRCASLLFALLASSAAAVAGAINTDSGLGEGKGQMLSKTQIRYLSLEGEVERLILRETFFYGVSERIGVLGTLGYLWNSPGADGIEDLLLRARYEFFGRDAKLQTLSFSAQLGVEIPLGNNAVGTPDGGLLVGLSGTWEKNHLRIDGDLIGFLRPNAPETLRADLGLSFVALDTKTGIWLAVLELNFERSAGADILFLSPGVVFEWPGWKIEFSAPIRIAEDASGPLPEYALVFSVVHVF